MSDEHVSAIRLSAGESLLRLLPDKSQGHDSTVDLSESPDISLSSCRQTICSAHRPIRYTDGCRASRPPPDGAPPTVPLTATVMAFHIEAFHPRVAAHQEAVRTSSAYCRS